MPREYLTNSNGRGPSGGGVLSALSVGVAIAATALSWFGWAVLWLIACTIGSLLILLLLLAVLGRSDSRR